MTEIAIKAAVDAGNAILEIYKQGFEVEFKEDNSPLTTADKAAHEIIVQALESTPYPLLSEESSEITYTNRKSWETYWLVDPLDGTKEFIKKTGEFTVNIALIEDGVPIFGIVYVPVSETMYCGHSVEDTKNAHTLQAWKSTNCSEKTVDEIVNSAMPLNKPDEPRSHVAPLRVVASASHCNDETRNFITLLENKYGNIALVSSGSSLKICMVAEGSADVYPRIAPTMEWDTAAAHAVVKAMGGEIFQYDEALPISAYSIGAGTGSYELDNSRSPRPLRYNKENLLNPSFVVSGIRI